MLFLSFSLMGTIFGFFVIPPCAFFSAVVIIEDGRQRDVVSAEKRAFKGFIQLVLKAFCVLLCN